MHAESKPAVTGRTSAGTFRIIQMTQGLSSDARPQAHLMLGNRSATLSAPVAARLLPTLEPARPLDVVEVEWTRPEQSDKGRLEITELRRIPVARRQAVELVPEALVPHREGLAALAVCVQSIRHPALLDFVGRVFEDADTALAFVSRPAAYSYHHGFPGGLLVHCVEVAHMAASLCEADSDTRDLAIVAGLFHDIGKIRTLDPEGRLTECGKRVGHDHLTLEMLARPLAECDVFWPAGALALREVWAPQSLTQRPKSWLASVVQYADRTSAAPGCEQPPAAAMLPAVAPDIGA